jgi:hypothetical protein
MENRSVSIELKNSIQRLEVQLAYEEQLLKEQFNLTYEHFKPVNLLKSTIQEIAASPYLVDNIIATAVSLATGYLSKKIVIGTSGNIFRKFLGLLMQLGVTNTVAQHPDTIKSIGQYIYQHFIRNKREEI